MQMTMKVQFDPLTTAGSSLRDAVLKVAADAEVTFHNTREKPKPKTTGVKA